MNNEPVAWMKSNGEVSVTKGEAFCIPLYTHPVKELTDEEIIEFIESWEGLVVTKRTIEMLRAIIRKVQK